ncbi:MAG: c-type cytochrome domain-containing protein [Chryseotalea sp.]
MIVPIACVCVWLLTITCTHDVAVPDSPEISFSGQILPIIASNCGTSGCHDGGEEFSLRTFEEIRGNVTPGDARKSKLYKAITRLNFEPMPPDGPLTDQQINVIYAWIMQGAKNN